MTVTVLLFASYAEALGRTELRMELPNRATVGHVMDRLRGLPGADRIPPAPLVAVNEQYSCMESELCAGDEVAVIPPVAGG